MRRRNLCATLVLIFILIFNCVLQMVDSRPSDFYLPRYREFTLSLDDEPETSSYSSDNDNIETSDSLDYPFEMSESDHEAESRPSHTIRITPVSFSSFISQLSPNFRFINMYDSYEKSSSDNSYERTTSSDFQGAEFGGHDNVDSNSYHPNVSPNHNHESNPYQPNEESNYHSPIDHVKESEPQQEYNDHHGNFWSHHEIDHGDRGHLDSGNDDRSNYGNHQPPHHQPSLNDDDQSRHTQPDNEEAEHLNESPLKSKESANREVDDELSLDKWLPYFESERIVPTIQPNKSATDHYDHQELPENGHQDYDSGYVEESPPRNENPKVIQNQKVNAMNNEDNEDVDYGNRDHYEIVKMTDGDNQRGETPITIKGSVGSSDRDANKDYFSVERPKKTFDDDNRSVFNHNESDDAHRRPKPMIKSNKKKSKVSDQKSQEPDQMDILEPYNNYAHDNSERNQEMAKKKKLAKLKRPKTKAKSSNVRIKTTKKPIDDIFDNYSNEEINQPSMYPRKNTNVDKSKVEVDWSFEPYFSDVIEELGVGHTTTSGPIPIHVDPNAGRGNQEEESMDDLAVSDSPIDRPYVQHESPADYYASYGLASITNSNHEPKPEETLPPGSKLQINYQAGPVAPKVKNFQLGLNLNVNSNALPTPAPLTTTEESHSDSSDDENSSDSKDGDNKGDDDQHGDKPELSEPMTTPISIEVPTNVFGIFGKLSDDKKEKSESSHKETNHEDNETEDEESHNTTPPTMYDDHTTDPPEIVELPRSKPQDFAFLNKKPKSSDEGQWKESKQAKTDAANYYPFQYNIEVRKRRKFRKPTRGPVHWKDEKDKDKTHVHEGRDRLIDKELEHARYRLLEHKEEEHWHEKKWHKERLKEEYLDGNPMEVKVSQSPSNIKESKEEQEARRNNPLPGYAQMMHPKATKDEIDDHFAIPSRGFRVNRKFVDWVENEVPKGPRR